MTPERARRRLDRLREQKRDWILEGTRAVQRRWHNQKYFTWVEQQGKTAAQLAEQADPAYWEAARDRADEIDRGILERRSAS